MSRRDGHHGHEEERHRRLKLAVAAASEAAGWDLVICEHGGSDIAVLRREGGVYRRAAAEVECSDRHAVENLLRNLRRGCELSVAVCPDLATAAAVARRMDRELSPMEKEGTGLITVPALRWFSLPQLSAPTRAEDPEEP